MRRRDAVFGGCSCKAVIFVGLVSFVRNPTLTKATKNTKNTKIFVSRKDAKKAKTRKDFCCSSRLQGCRASSSNIFSGDDQHGPIGCR